jgi:hypothetical protein
MACNCGKSALAVPGAQSPDIPVPTATWSVRFASGSIGTYDETTARNTAQAYSQWGAVLIDPNGAEVPAAKFGVATVAPATKRAK